MIVDSAIRCRHGIRSGSGCHGCGDVVQTLYGERPWWTPLWRLWHVAWALTGRMP